MEKIYKSRPHRILVNLIFGAVVAFVVWIISGFWLEEPWTYVVGIGMFAVYFLLIISGNLITIRVSGNTMSVHKGKKLLHSFHIDECGFHARTKSSSGDTECSLYVTTPDGHETHIDCELIGVTKFNELIGDLGIVGEKAQINEITTTRK